MKRRKDEWVHIRHKSGDVLKVRIHKIHGPTNRGAQPSSIRLAFLDDDRNFEINQGFDDVHRKGVAG